MENQRPTLAARFGAISLLTSSNAPSVEHVLRTAGPGVVCDFHVADIELRPETEWGYDAGELCVVDHHAPVARWERHISSGNLARRYLAERGPAPHVIVNHTDCDSIVSAGLVSGMLQPRDEYDEAVIAADHTGAIHPFSELLQSISGERDLALSFDALARYEAGHAQTSQVQALLDDTLRVRRLAAELAAGPVRWLGRVAHIEAPGRVESDYFLPHLPEAELIAVTFPLRRDPSRTALKLRLGHAAPSGVSLQRVDLHDVDPAYAGRWNAGSNQRGGGSMRHPRELVEGVAERLAAHVASLRLAR